MFDNAGGTFCYLTEDRSTTDCYTFDRNLRTGIDSLTCDLVDCPRNKLIHHGCFRIFTILKIFMNWRYMLMRFVQNKF